MRLFFIFLILLFSVPAYSQGMIGKSRSFVMENLKKYNTGADSLKSITMETDSTIQFKIQSASSVVADFTYGFDKQGKCHSEKKASYTDNAYRKLLRQVLDQQQFGWKRINENQYVSKFSGKMLIELPGDPGIFVFTIIRTDWNKATYDLIVNNQ